MSRAPKRLRVFRKHSVGIPGSGIGLTLVQVIVKRMQGEVSLESSPEQGTTMTVRLPEAGH